ncbi:MAG: flagellar basal body-associated FliL family protein, partial [Vagococcus sp.]
KYNKDEVSVPLEEFLVNLADNKEGETSYIRIEISLLTNNAKNAEIIESNKDLIRDSVINKLRQKEANEILADKNGVNNLKEELRDQINKDYGSALVREVFITNLVIQ